MSTMLNAGPGAIPVIDVRALDVHPSQTVVDEFGSACADLGFLVISGHGIGDDVIAPMLDATKKFFALPTDAKEAHRSPFGNQFRGFTAQSRYQDGPPDLKEGFQVSLFDTADDMRSAGYSDEFAAEFEPNIWPSQPGEFQHAWRTYLDRVRDLGDYLMRIAALALELPENWFEDKFSRQSSYLLGNYYPAQDASPLAGQQRLHAHTDFGAFTILYQDNDLGGLEVLRRDGSWLRVPAIPGTFIVNLGDMLANWTNDRWVATMHRVRNTEESEAGSDRISVPFFQHPNLDAMIETIPTCLEPGEAPKHAPIMWRDWGKHRMSEVTK
jgi:isopenicillin N synthase-like dioxygenase